MKVSTDISWPNIYNNFDFSDANMSIYHYSGLIFKIQGPLGVRKWPNVAKSQNRKITNFSKKFFKNSLPERLISCVKLSLFLDFSQIQHFSL